MFESWSLEVVLKSQPPVLDKIRKICIPDSTKERVNTKEQGENVALLILSSRKRDLDPNAEFLVFWSSPLSCTL